MVDPLIYHGTPLTPRAALLDVLAGRSACVSFFRPDDVEAVEAVCPQVMFRQRCLQRVAGCAEARGRMVYPFRLDALFRLAGASSVSTRPVGSDARCAGSAKPAQRQSVAGMAVWASRSAAVAHGRANRSAAEALRPLPSRLLGMDWGRQASGSARVSYPHGRGGQGFRQSLACPAHDARPDCGADVSLCQRRRDNAGTEWMAI